MKVKPCRECGADVFWWQSPAAKWQQYSAAPVTFDGSPGLVLHRRRGLVDAGSVWPEPPQMFPSHWHPRRKDEQLPVLSDVLDDWVRQEAPPVGRRKLLRVVKTAPASAS